MSTLFHTVASQSYVSNRSVILYQFLVASVFRLLISLAIKYLNFISLIYAFSLVTSRSKMGVSVVLIDLFRHIYCSYSCVLAVLHRRF